MMNYEDKLVINLEDVSNIAELGIKITNILDNDSSNKKTICLKLGNIDLKQSQLLSIKALIEAMQSKLEMIETTSEFTESSAIALGLSVGKLSETKVDVQPVEAVNVSKSFEEELTSSSGDLNSFAQLKQMNSLGDKVTNTSNLVEVETPSVETEDFSTVVSESDSNLAEASKSERVANIYDSLGKEMTHSDIQDALDITFGSNENSIEPADIKSETSGLSEDYNIIPSEDLFSHVKSEPVYGDIEITETVEKEEDDKYVLLDTEGITPEGLELIKTNTSDLETLYLTQTLRSGQTVSFEGNIFLIGDAHPGSEINATGDITVWGILGGIVHAGTKGNTDAKVRALKLNPIQLRIANLYSRRNDTVNVPYVQKTNEFTPEEARIERGQIVIYKTLRRED